MPQEEKWPRQCPSCERHHFRNPVPVCVVVLPVDKGVLTVRRAIPPGIGQLALPGGFVDWGESWQEAGAREVLEETGVQIEASELKLLGAESVADGVMLLFAQAQKRAFSELKLQLDQEEISEVVILEEACDLAFSTHTEYLRRFFLE